MNDTARRCLQASLTYTEDGKVQDGLLLLERAILACPDDADLVLQYVDRAEAAFAAEEADARFEALEGFTRSRVLHVALDRVDDVIRRADALRTRREGLASAVELHDPHDDARVREVLAAAGNGSLGDEPPAPGEDIVRYLRLLEGARELAEGNDKAMSTISSAIERAQLAHLSDVVGLQARDLIARAAQWGSPARAACALQHADAALGPIAALSDKLDPQRVVAIDGLLVELKDAATRLATVTHEAEAAEGWAAFRTKHAEDMDSVIAFKAPGNDLPDSFCQRVLEKAKTLHEQLLDLLPSLRSSSVLDPARSYAAKIALAGTRAAQAQQKRYDGWALTRIREGYTAGKKFVGVIDDEKKLGDALVSEFGGIDVRFLKHEVQRCYGEVFELLFEHLDKPSSPDDFDDHGNKLNVLSRMLAVGKLAPSDF